MIPWTVANQAPLSMGILQARILEWVAMPSARGSSQPRDQTQVSRVAGGFFTISATMGQEWSSLAGVSRSGYGLIPKLDWAGSASKHPHLVAGRI